MRVYYFILIFLENKLAMQILNFIHQGHQTFFYYYLRNMPKYKTPIMYDQKALDLFKEDELYEELDRQLAKYKESYNDLRKLVYSHGDVFRKKFIGSFLLGDYLWALYIIFNK